MPAGASPVVSLNACPRQVLHMMCISRVNCPRLPPNRFTRAGASREDRLVQTPVCYVADRWLEQGSRKNPSGGSPMSAAKKVAQVPQIPLCSSLLKQRCRRCSSNLNVAARKRTLNLVSLLTCLPQPCVSLLLNPVAAPTDSLARVLRTMRNEGFPPTPDISIPVGHPDSCQIQLVHRQPLGILLPEPSCVDS